MFYMVFYALLTLVLFLWNKQINIKQLELQANPISNLSNRFANRLRRRRATPAKYCIQAQEKSSILLDLARNQP